MDPFARMDLTPLALRRSSAFICGQSLAESEA